MFWISVEFDYHLALKISTLEILVRVRAEGAGLGGSQASDGIEFQHPGNSGEGGTCGGDIGRY